MTISKTAREIAEEFCRSNDRSVDELERAILRHMEHHIVTVGHRLREALRDVVDTWDDENAGDLQVQYSVDRARQELGVWSGHHNKRDS